MCYLMVMVSFISFFLFFLEGEVLPIPEQRGAERISARLTFQLGGAVQYSSSGQPLCLHGARDNHIAQFD